MLCKFWMEIIDRIRTLFWLGPRWVQTCVEQCSINRWNRAGRPSPGPCSLKIRTVRDSHRQYPHDTFVETGTYCGNMVYAQRRTFSKIYSIELSSSLFAKARRKFKGYPHIELIQGDSGLVLQSLVPRLTGPAFFWLDAHYSGGPTARGDVDSPILAELSAIFKSPFKHTILIDDARCFDGAHDYPSIQALEAFVKANSPFPRQLEVKDDIIRLTC